MCARRPSLIAVWLSDAEQHGGGRHGEQHGEGVQPQPGAERERLDDVLDGVVGEQHDRQHGQRVPEPTGPVGDQGREGAGHERPDVGHVARHERHQRDRRREGNAERPGTDEHHCRVGCTDDRQTHGVATEGQHRVLEDVAPELRRQGDVAGRPSGDLGPVLEQEQQHEQGEHTAHDQTTRRAEQGPQHPVHEQVDNALREVAQPARALGGAGGRGVGLLQRAVELGPDLVALADQPADDDRHDRHDDGQARDEHEGGAQPPRDPPPLEAIGERHQQRSQHRGDRQRDGDLGNQGREQQSKGENTGHARISHAVTPTVLNHGVVCAVARPRWAAALTRRCPEPPCSSVAALCIASGQRGGTRGRDTPGMVDSRRHVVTGRPATPMIRPSA